MIAALGTEAVLIVLAIIASIGAGFFAWIAALSARQHQSHIEREDCEERIRQMRNG